MARPQKEIPTKEFEKLCGLQCTKEEICGFFDVTDKTLESWCKREYGRGFSEVFRRYQFELAKRSAAMAIFLGKNYLNQREMPDIEDPESLKRAREILEGIGSAIN